VQRSRIPAHIYFGNGALAQGNSRFAAGLADTASDEFAEIRIMADHHDYIVLGVLIEKFAEVGE